jgi:hypothetical protein
MFKQIIYTLSYHMIILVYVVLFSFTAYELIWHSMYMDICICGCTEDTDDAFRFVQ